jgi:hypothetical protein
MQVIDRPPIDHSLNAGSVDDRARGWGIEIGPDGEVRQGPEPGSSEADTEAETSAPYPWSREARRAPPEGL